MRSAVNVAGYIRVSSRSQDYATQRHAIQRAARARGDRVTSWFEEKQSRTLSPFRAELHNLREAVRVGRVTKVYVYRLDRLSEGIRATLGLLEELRGAGCRVVTIADGFSLDSGPVADVVVAVMAWAAQMERAAIGERVAAARQRIEAAGGAWGRPRGLTDGAVEKIRARSRRGDSIRAISVALKVPRSTVADVVSEKGPYKQVRKPRKKRARPRLSE